MPAITFENFSGGMDLRRDPALSAANVLLVLSNAYINTGKAIKKRPCLTRVGTLEAGTKGLRSAGGKLNTFYGQGAAIAHANSLFRANRVPHPTSGATAISKVYYGENFNGLLYAAVGYANGDVKHHYLDDSTLTAWAAAGAIAVGQFRRPTTANGFRYEVTAVAGSGTTAGVEPTWPLTIGATVIDNAGANQVTWTCRSNAITDTNCPHTRQVRKLSQKIYAAHASNVAFCATAAPRDWTTANDAGFIPCGISAPGADTVTAVGDWNGDLVVSYADSMQMWDVDSDPANNALSKSSPNTGSIHADTGQSLAGDFIFLSQQGFRSASLLTLTNNLQEVDMGSAIDALRSEIADTDDPLTIYFPKLGQLWTINGAKVYVYASSRTVKLSAWQTFTFPVSIEAAAVLNNALYLRSGDEIYRVDDTAYTDDGAAPLVEAQMFYQDNKTPGILKMFTGFDGLMTGSPEIAFKFQAKKLDGTIDEISTEWVSVTADLRPGALNAMELCAVAVAPKIRHQLGEDFKCSQLMLYYENLGAV